MNLPFKTHWADGTPTYFIPKIWKSIYDTRYDIFKSEFIKYTNEENIVYLMDDLKKYTSKLHTIRKGNRWRAGMKIHFGINPRSKNYFQFAPVLEVKTVQNIRMIKIGEKFNITINSNIKFSHSSNVKELDFFAQNDGFNSFVEFEKFFFPNGFGEFEGQIIHWTDLRY